MASQTNILIVVVAALSATVTAQLNYFDYSSDCERDCIKQNISCLIQKEKDHYPSWCQASPMTCCSEASSGVVCLRPNLPAIGGESIWLSFRDKFHPSEPRDMPYRRYLHYALAGAGALIAIIVFLASALICMLYEKREPQYEQFANPSPNPEVDSPYLPTTVDI